MDRLQRMPRTGDEHEGRRHEAALNPRPLPFDAFLDLLRAKGYGVSLHEYAAVAMLLERWDRTNVRELGDAFAAVVARNDEEVQGISRLFREIYLPQPKPSVPPPVPPDRLAWVKRRAWVFALIAAMIVGGTAWQLWPAAPEGSTPPVAEVVPPVQTPTQTEAVPLPPPPAPEIPPASPRIERPFAAGASAAGFLLCLSAFWLLKLRDDRRVWLRNTWSSLTATLPGPFHFTEVVRDLPTRLPKTDVEDAATLLGRVFSKTGQARELDVVRSVRETLRRGLMPTLLTKPRRIAETIVVLQDVGQEMEVWRGKVTAFLGDLRRQGISLQPFYFDGDITRVSDRPHRAAVSLESILRTRADAPVMIVSSGGGLAALVEAPDRHWLRLLAKRPRTTWLTPVSDVRLWPSVFASLPMSVWPMTRTGLASAARELAGADADTSAVMRTRIEREGYVSLADVERLKRLASLAPHPSPALLDSLRRRFAPDVSDAALLHVMNAGGGAAAPVIQLPDEELRRHVNAMRRETPDLERDARESILAVFEDSQPIPGSAAHTRWQIAVEMQRLQLADLSGATGDARAAMERLKALAAGPMAMEVRESLRLIPATTTMAERAGEVGAESRAVPSSAIEARARQAGMRGMRWSWPGLREMVPAGVAAGVLFLVALGLGVLPARALEHVQEAYGLEYLARPSASTPQLAITIAGRDPSLPRNVDLYKENQLFRSGIDVTAGSPTSVSLGSNDTGAHYQARARLPEGNFAVSPWVWVTSDKLSFVLVDAAPWANVTITGDASNTPVQPTPFTAALLPGTYQLRFENPSLGAQSVVQQTLTVPGPPAIRVNMPGFDAAQTVESILRQQPARPTRPPGYGATGK